MMAWLLTAVAILWLAPSLRLAPGMRVRAVDPAGLPQQGVLIEAHAFGQGPAIYRGLTRSDGWTAAFPAEEGGAEIIAARPFSGWAPAVADVLVPADGLDLVLTIRPTGSATVVSLAPEQLVTILGPRGSPIVHSKIFIRERNGRQYFYYETDGSGRATIVNPGPDYVLVAMAEQKVFTTAMPPCYPGPEVRRCPDAIVQLKGAK